MTEKQKSYGKEFERQVFKNFSEVKEISIDRIPDQVTKYKGSSSNICDFIVYSKPNLIYLECKTVHGATLPFSNIRENQWNGLLEKSKIDGVIAGIMCWWVDYDVTRFIPIQTLEVLRLLETKSIRYDLDYVDSIFIVGRKKRTLFEYDMRSFLANLKNNS